MMDLNSIAEENNFGIKEALPLGGGDINEVFLISTRDGENLVLKINDAQDFPGMFEAEKKGLETLKAVDCIDVPTVINTGQVGDTSYLLLEHKPKGRQNAEFWEEFGIQLAALHQNSNKKFGFAEDNYIGSLLQQNTWCKEAPEFFIKRRLEPQLALADKYDLGIGKYFLRNIAENIPDEEPSLIHGDLWNGNFLVNAEGYPCLFDPAVSYGPREMDLAMMKLFGGFDRRLFDSYNESFPLERGFEERVPLWQLYYLLIHLNIFGKGYRSQVLNIIGKYN